MGWEFQCVTRITNFYLLFIKTVHLFRNLENVFVDFTKIICNKMAFHIRFVREHSSDTNNEVH